MKKFIKIIIILLIICIMSKEDVKAEAINEYYSNYYGINIPINQYNELKKYYTESFIYTMNEEEYENIMKNDLKNIVVTEANDFINMSGIVPYSTSFSTSYKTIRIINNNGYITLSLVWKTMPKIRSYDVIAVRLNGVSVSGATNFKQTYVKNGYTYISYTGTKKEFSNGFGYSFKLSENDYLESSLSFWVSGKGTIYGSYQHAHRTTTLNQSKKYSLSSSGYGRVILFESSVKSYYDAMSGVSINV